MRVDSLGVDAGGAGAPVAKAIGRTAKNKPARKRRKHALRTGALMDWGGTRVYIP
ncbi:MAG: hypothetical protein L0170_10760 [Acidobacteria bacterium]|nr:hypothetical protein [Acidobacteriota bacterium]